MTYVKKRETLRRNKDKETASAKSGGRRKIRRYRRMMAKKERGLWREGFDEEITV
jgi:hypothetical protein